MTCSQVYYTWNKCFQVPTSKILTESEAANS